MVAARGHQARHGGRHHCHLCALRSAPFRMATGDTQPVHCTPAFPALPRTDAQALKPGGLLLIRDYGRHDLAQLRVKKDRLLDPNIPDLYIRGDGTRVYFFTKDELEGMLVEPALEEETGTEHMFDILQMGEDRRLVGFVTWAGPS